MFQALWLRAVSVTTQLGLHFATTHTTETMGTGGIPLTLFAEMAMLDLPCWQVIVCQLPTWTFSRAVIPEVRSPHPPLEVPVVTSHSRSLKQPASGPHPSCLYFCPWHCHCPIHDVLSTYHLSPLFTHQNVSSLSASSVLLITLFPAPKAVPGTLTFSSY